MRTSGSLPILFNHKSRSLINEHSSSLYYYGPATSHTYIIIITMTPGHNFGFLLLYALITL